MADKTNAERAERCKQVAGELLGYMPRVQGREGLYVTVIVHERDGTELGLVSSCVTARELSRLSAVLGEAAEDAAELALDVAATRISPWELG